MANIEPIPDELVREQWSAIMLTNRRVIGPGRHGGTIFLVLDRVDWAGIRTTHHPVLVLLALALMLIALLAWRGYGPVLLAAGVVFLVAYFVTRSTSISVGAGSGLIEHKLPRGGYDEAVNFCRKIVAEAHGVRSAANNAAPVGARSALVPPPEPAVA